MAPISAAHQPRYVNSSEHGRGAMDLEYTIVEAWSQGVLVGGLIVLVLITLANIRRYILLHKLILLELFLTLGHGTFIFFPDPIYGWYLSSTAVLLYASFLLHNVISWMKIKPFLSRLGSRFFIGTVILCLPYWIAEIYFNFEYFNFGTNSYNYIRPWEVVSRDGWWIFTAIWLVYSIKQGYNVRFSELVKASPRFGILIGCVLLSIAFIITDLVIGVTVPRTFKHEGMNPFWKFYIVTKCTSDVIFLDDFKSVIDRLVSHPMRKIGCSVSHGDTVDTQSSIDQRNIRIQIVALD